MNVDVLSNRLGVDIEPQLLELALTHRSYAYENGNTPNNERLEFLGDSVLGFVVTAHIHDLLTDLPEGELTKVKNAVVSATALSQVATSIGLGEFLRLGKGEDLNPLQHLFGARQVAVEDDRDHAAEAADPHIAGRQMWPLRAAGQRGGDVVAQRHQPLHTGGAGGSDLRIHRRTTQRGHVQHPQRCRPGTRQ